jgi:hypothetical protein
MPSPNWAWRTFCPAENLASATGLMVVVFLRAVLPQLLVRHGSDRIKKGPTAKKHSLPVVEA